MAPELLDLEPMALTIGSTADWRRKKAAEHPDDATRNLAAAACLDIVAGGVEALEGSDVHVRLSGLFFSSDDDGYSFTQAENDLQSCIYFDHPNARSYFEALVSSLEGQAVAA